MLTRKLTGFKIKGLEGKNQFVFEWTKKNDSGALETYSYRGIEPPRPELLTAAKNVAILACKMVNLSTTESEARSSALFYAINFEYPESDDRYEVKIKSSVEIQFGYQFTFSTPKWKVYYSNSRGEYNNMVRDTIHALLQECWKYIDGERAQTKLSFQGESEDGAA